MSIVSSSLRGLTAFLQDHQVSFSNGLLILFTVGGEQIFKSAAYHCPCEQPDAFKYAIVFMFVPALVLGIIGVAVSNLTWRILHGCLHRAQTSKNGALKTSGCLFIAIARAAIVPSAWLFIQLLDGSYYACMRAEKPCEKGSVEYESLMAESQILSWMFLGCLVTVSFIVICIVRCSDSVTYMQYKYLSSYREAEQNKWDKLIQENTANLAESNVKAFIEQKDLNKKDWDDISKVSDHTIQIVDKGNGADPSSVTSTDAKDLGDGPKVFLTPLHEWNDLHKMKIQPEAQEDASV